MGFLRHDQNPPPGNPCCIRHKRDQSTAWNRAMRLARKSRGQTSLTTRFSDRVLGSRVLYKDSTDCLDKRQNSELLLRQVQCPTE